MNSKECAKMISIKHDTVTQGLCSFLDLLVTMHQILAMMYVTTLLNSCYYYRVMEHTCAIFHIIYVLFSIFHLSAFWYNGVWSSPGHPAMVL